jgi:hypothetical protein
VNKPALVVNTPPYCRIPPLRIQNITAIFVLSDCITNKNLFYGWQ